MSFVELYAPHAVWPNGLEPRQRFKALFVVGSRSWSRSPVRQLHLCADLLRSAGIDIKHDAVCISARNGEVLLIRRELTPDASTFELLRNRERNCAYLPVSRLPEELRESSVALVGEGFVLFTSSEDPRAAVLPELVPQVSMLTAARVRQEEAPLPGVKGLAWRQYKVGRLSNKNTPYLDVGGNIWELAGFQPGAAIVVVRHSDGVLVRPPLEGEHPDGTLVVKKTLQGKPYGHKRFGETLLTAVSRNKARVIVTKGMLLLVGERYALSRFGLSAKHELKGNMPLEPAALEHRQTGSRPRNYSAYPKPSDDSRLQVQGEWLARYGFTPGAKYVLESHPLVKGRVLARLDPQGDLTVVANTDGGAPKLYIPAKMLSHFRSDQVRVCGTIEGLHIQQFFATRARPSSSPAANSLGVAIHQ